MQPTRAPFLVVAAFLAAPAAATDYYVDVVNGDDANGGLTPSTAFGTIAHAIDATPDLSTTRLLIAPGTYDQGSGESFPLVPRDRALVGTEGSAETIVVGLPSAIVVHAWNDLVLEGLTLRQGFAGVATDLHAPDDVEPRWNLRDLVVLDMDSHGIQFHRDEFNEPLPFVRMTDTHVRRCDVGFRWYEFTTQPSALVDVVMEDCSFTDNRMGAELHADSFDSFGRGDLVVRRCVFSGNAQDGLKAFFYHLADVRIEDSLFADNGGSGCMVVILSGSWPTGPKRGVARSNTSANNGGRYGLLLSVQQGEPTNEVSYNVCRGNGDGSPNEADLAVSGVPTAIDNIVGAAGGPAGSWVVDPRFVDAAQGDYRLAGDSPAIDAIPGASGALDLAGLPRGIDGDLDAVPADDYGALEHRSLSGPMLASIGGTVALEAFGPTPGSSRVFGMRAAPFDPPTPTPFGDLSISRNDHVAFGAVASHPTNPGVKLVPIPNQPSLVGTTITFQALTTTPNGPTNWRLTNPVAVLIVP